MDTTKSLFLPPGSSTHAGDVDALFYFIFIVAIILFVLLFSITAYLVLKYRRSRHAESIGASPHNTPLEIAWTVIPMILVFIVFFWGFRDYLKLYVVPKDALEIKVTGQQWFWSFDYPEGISTVNEMVVPVDKPVKVLLSSKDVIHSFFVPGFRIKMDAVPNRYTITWFEATHVGEYDLFCAEYCGTKHSEMIGKVKVVTEREYQDWLDKGAAAGEGMTPAEYGKKLYAGKGCITCHSIDGSANTGPSFLNRFGVTHDLEGGGKVTVDENYIRESILNPRAKVVLGYQPVMPTYQGLLKDRDIDALIAFIKSLKKNENESEKEK
jgi:cytochrome c oxidase subunit 2